MMGSSPERADEVYHEEDEPYDEHTYREEERRRFPYLPVSPWGLWPSSSQEDAHRTYTGGTADEERTSGGVGRFWDEGLITLVIVGGAILFFFPEPATSGLGILLMGLGVLAWLLDWAT